MRYRSAAFARLSAHALAGDGSTHFPARGVDADALLGKKFHAALAARRARRLSRVTIARRYGRRAVAEN